VKLFGDHDKVDMLDDQIDVFGYLGDKPFGGGCLPNQWTYEAAPGHSSGMTMRAAAGVPRTPAEQQERAWAGDGSRPSPSLSRV
jgi:hypothetical protein